MRRNARGTSFKKVVDAGKSIATDKRRKAKRKVPSSQGDRGDRAYALLARLRWHHRFCRKGAFPYELLDDGKQFATAEWLLEPRMFSKADWKQGCGISRNKRHGDALRFQHFGELQTDRDAPQVDVQEGHIGSFVRKFPQGDFDIRCGADDPVADLAKPFRHDRGNRGLIFDDQYPCHVRV